jgi:hypothetical protein
MHTACVWSEKLPFAGYSVEKDHAGLGIRALQPGGEALAGPALNLRAGVSDPGDRRPPVVVASKPYRAGVLQDPQLRQRPTHRGRFKQSGEYRARTGDLLVANQALSQLS